MIANVNPETGIRYGIIRADNLEPEIIETIQHQGENLAEAAALAQIRLEVNREIANGDLSEDDFDDEVDRRIEEWCEGAGSEEVHSYTEGEPGSPDRLEVQTTWLGGALHVFCFRSPRLTTVRLCSPCVPNCGDLDSLDPNGYDCYDVPPDWRRESESAETEAEVALNRVVTARLSPENENEDVRTADDLFGFIRNELENANIGAYLQLEKNGREPTGSTSEDLQPLVRLTEDEVRELVVPGDYLTIEGLTKFAKRVQDALIKKNDAEKS